MLTRLRSNFAQPARAFALAVTSVGFNQSAFLVLMPVIVAQSGLGVGQVGLAAMTGTLAFLVASPLWGRAGGVVGRHRLFPVLAGVMVIAQIMLAGLLLAGPGLSQVAFATLVVSRIIYGVGSAGVMPQAQAAIIRATAPDKRPAALAMLSAGLGLGRILGSLVTALAALSPLIAPLTMALSPLVLLAAPSGVADAAPTRELVALRRRILPLLGLGFALTLGFGQIQTTLALLLQSRLDLAAAEAAGLMGVLYALVACAMVAVQILVVPRLAFRLARNLRLGALGLAGGTALVAVGSNLALIATGLLLTGAGVALATPAYTTWLAQRSDGQQAGNAGWLASAHVLGQGCGALTGAYAFQAWTALPFVLSAVLGLAVVLVSFAIQAPARES